MILPIVTTGVIVGTQASRTPRTQGINDTIATIGTDATIPCVLESGSDGSGGRGGFKDAGDEELTGCDDSTPYPERQTCEKCEGLRSPAGCRKTVRESEDRCQEGSNDSAGPVGMTRVPPCRENNRKSLHSNDLRRHGAFTFLNAPYGNPHSS